MGDSSGTKAPSIPSWQRQQQPQRTDSDGEDSNESHGDAVDNSPRDGLLQKASKFLEEDGIREAPVERKVSFLKGKGLTSEETQSLLGEQPEYEEESPDSEGVPSQREEQSESHVNSLPTRRPNMSPEADSTSSQDIPPIITYPEFLTHSQKPPPIITAQRLLTTAYVVSGAAALTYGTSKYIVEPMIESLTSARQSYFETATGNLDTLNEKLESTVSTVPDDQEPSRDSVDDGEELEASAFFNRSAGTQTTPHHSQSGSSSPGPAQEQPSAAETQTTRLRSLEEDLKDLLSPAHMDTQGLEPSNHAKNKLDDFQRYLDGLMYGNAETVPGFAGSKGREDSIAKVKAEIRQTKGALLSSKNFPSSVGTKGWGMT